LQNQKQMADDGKNIAKPLEDEGESPDRSLEPADSMGLTDLEQLRRAREGTVEDVRDDVEEVLEIPLLGTVLEVPLGNVEGAKEVLEKVKKLLEKTEFLQKVEKAYPDTSELEEQISEIQKTLEEKKEAKEEGEEAEEEEEEKEEEERPTPPTKAEGEEPEPEAAEPAEPAAPPAAEEAKPAGGLGKLGEALGAKTALIAAIGNDEFLNAIYRIKDAAQQREVLKTEFGFEVASKKELRKALEQVIRAICQKYDLSELQKFDSLDIDALAEMGIKPEHFDEIAEGLGEVLPHAPAEPKQEPKTEPVKAAEPEPEPKPEPAPTPAPAAPAEPAKAAPKAAEEKEEAKKAPAESVDELVDELFELLDEDEEANADFDDLLRMIRLIKTSPKRVPRRDKGNYRKAMQELFGTTRIQEVRDKIKEQGGELLRSFLRGHVFVQGGGVGEIDEKRVLRNLVGTLAGKKTPKKARAALAKLTTKLRSLRSGGPAAAEVTEPKATAPEVTGRKPRRAC
jgi:chemotaxis protein histidine kinase CheA